MHKFLLVIFLLSSSLFFSSCSEKEKTLRVSATTWIGYSPLYYAKEKGWLKPLNIKLLHVSSLSENLYLYEAKNSDAYVGTQYEYGILSKKDATLAPIILFDRSNGGDVVMSNVSIEILQQTKESIDAYLEMDSINKTMLEDFLVRYNLKDKEINYINRDQVRISILNAKKISKPTIAITYIPYDIQLQKKGFKIVASTKDNLNLLVIDALFTNQKIFNEHKNQFYQLKVAVDNALIALEQNPKEFYDTIKPYILEISYEEFLSSLDGIIWINKNLSEDLKKRMKESSFPTRSLI
jgi:NitT/TauT family transport system substrate-binding protein